MRHHDDPVHHPKQTDCKSSTKRGNTAVAADATDQGPLEITVMTPKERKIYEAILAGNFRALDAGKSKKEKRKPKEKSARYPSFDVLELARLVEDCNDFVQNSNKSMSLYPMTKQQRIQVYSLATLYNFKKESVGKGGNRSPVLLKSKKSTIPHYRVLAQFIRDSVESPTSLKALYLDLDQHGAPPPSVSMAMGMGMAMAASRERERETQQYGLESAGRERARARFVGENANPVGMDNVGNRMLRGMGWTGGGLGARGEGITEPISQKMKFSRSGLG